MLLGGRNYTELINNEPRPEVKPLVELLRESGHLHEQVLITQLKAEGKQVAELEGGQGEADYEATIAAMRSGVDFIWQASMRNEEMRGSADLLERIDRPSALGGWSYIPIECKLSSHSKPIYLVQACAYCDLLTPILGQRPDRFKLYLGGRRFLAYASGEFWGWHERLRQRYRDFRAAFDPKQEPIDVPGDHGPGSPSSRNVLKQSVIDLGGRHTPEPARYCVPLASPPSMPWRAVQRSVG